MNEQLQSAMREATRLTQAGRLVEATALIQRTLAGADVSPRWGEASNAPPAADIIEGEFHVYRGGAGDRPSTCASRGQGCRAASPRLAGAPAREADPDPCARQRG